MWKPILRNIEFEYADGSLFWDKSGRVARDLTEAIPGLLLRNQSIEQRDFYLPNGTLELFYGIRAASLRTFEEEGPAFQKLAHALMEILTEELELVSLLRFRFQYALGWPCQSYEEAHMITMKLLPSELAGKLKSGEFQAAQLEVRSGAIIQTTRYTILELAPPQKEMPSRNQEARVPHAVSSVIWERFEKLPIREFKVASEIEAMEKHALAALSTQVRKEAGVKSS